MITKITVTNQEIIHQVKLSYQIPEIIEAIVTRKIIKETAIDAGIEVQLEELQENANRTRLFNKLNSANETWGWLEKYSLSLDDFEELVYLSIISGKLAKHLFFNQVEPYFFEHQLDYTGVVMYEVILDDEDLAMELFYAISEGEIGFPEVAHQYIQDIELRRSGGYKGIWRRQEMKPEISAAVFAATPPQVLKPIITASGVYLIFVEEIIQSQLDETLRTQILYDLFAQWIKEQIEQVEVIKNLE